MKNIIYILFFLHTARLMAQQPVWQWKVDVEVMTSTENNAHPQAFLWIPENYKQVKGVIVTQHNMIEEGMLENPYFREVMGELGFAEIWITPSVSITYDVNKGDDKVFDYVLHELAETSGYSELEFAPIVPMGHSALASYPWNFAAFMPERTLALVSVHGDSPQTNLTGSGRPNPDWENRSIDGIPALFIMGEYEWWDARIAPAYTYIAKHTESVITLFCDAGHGHFDYSEAMVKYVADYIRKAAKQRLPAKMPLNAMPKLIKVKPQQGWLMDKWRHDSLPQAPSAKYDAFKGERKTASWVFNKEHAKATEAFYAASRGKTMQYIGYNQNGAVLQPKKTHANYQLDFKPMDDGITFTVNAFFADSTKVNPAGDFAKTSISIDRICGPVKKVSDTTFQISFYRMGFNNPKRSNDIWLLAHNNGDATYKSVVQQLNLRFPIKNTAGMPQIIDFKAIADQSASIEILQLQASSSAKVPVSYYVKEGPAYIEGNELKFTPIPPRTKFPVKVTVVAWQYGMAGTLQSAEPVENTFYILKN